MYRVYWLLFIILTILQLTLVYILFHSSVDQAAIYTPNAYNYQIVNNLSGKTWISFRVNIYQITIPFSLIRFWKKK